MRIHGNDMPRLTNVTKVVFTIMMSVCLLFLGAPAIADELPDVGDETTTLTAIKLYPDIPRPAKPGEAFCVGGIGGDCNEWYTNPYNNKVLVTDEENDYIKSRHGISKGMIRWSIENGRYDRDINTNTSTRRGYRTVVRRMDCDPTCHDAGVRVDVISIVEWAGHGTNKGELVTMYCAKFSGMCPSWIRAL